MTDPFDTSKATPMGRITGYGVIDCRTGEARWWGEGKPDWWGRGGVDTQWTPSGHPVDTQWTPSGHPVDTQWSGDWLKFNADGTVEGGYGARPCQGEADEDG